MSETRRGRNAACAPRVLLAALAAAATLATPVAPAAADAARPSRWLAIGLLSGTTRFDAHLADYRWEVAPRAAWGAQVLAGTGRLAAGVRVSRAATVQALDLAGTPNPSVRATNFDVVGRYRVGSRWGTDLEAFGTVGRLGLAYHPDHLTIQGAGGSPNVDVTLAPLHATTAGGGFALRRPLAAAWAAAIEMDARSFRMNTAHQSGGQTVVARERFHDWNARLELARTFGRR